MWLDSLCQNEIGDPNRLLSDVCTTSSFSGKPEDSRAQNPKKSLEEDDSMSMNRTPQGMRDGMSLLDWESRDNLNLLYLLYDVTPVAFIDVVVSDVGILPPTSVAVVLRELHADRVSNLD